MERAGLAAAELARDRLLTASKSVLVLAGPGNNGGDGFVLARHLRSWWYRVTVVFTGERTRLSEDAAAAHDAWLAAGGTILSQLPDGGFDLVVDALFGIGLEREITGRYVELIEYVDRQPGTVLALDIPSGLHADSGSVLGRAVRADHTMTFIALKPGLLTLEGPDHCGELHVRDLGLAVEALVPAPGHAIRSQVLTRVLTPRALNTHKGSFGSVGIVGGATGMTGAALLAGRAALKLGTGRVYVGFLGSDAPHLDVLQPELMLRTASEVLAMDGLTSVVLGPGLSQSIAAFDAVKQALQMPVPLVVDADALSLLGRHAELQEICRLRVAPTVLTAASGRSCTTAANRHRASSEGPGAGGTRLRSALPRSRGAERRGNGHRAARCAFRHQHLGKSWSGQRRDGRCTVRHPRRAARPGSAR